MTLGLDARNADAQDLDARHSPAWSFHVFDRDGRRFKILRTYCEIAAIASIGLGCIVLYGWAFHIDVLMSVLPGLVTMKANTALGIVLAGTSLWLLIPGESRTRRGQIARLLALVVVLIGAATLAEYAFHLNLGIDEL